MELILCLTQQFEFDMPARDGSLSNWINSYRIKGERIVAGRIWSVVEKICQIFSLAFAKPDESGYDDDDESQGLRDGEEVDHFHHVPDLYKNC